MKLMLKRTAILTLQLLLIGALQAQSTDTLKVLFVGNSYTYFWNLSQTVEALANGDEYPVMVRKSTAGGASLRDHWEGKKNLQSRKVIKSNDWDIVVLQNHSRSSIDKPDEFTEYGNKFIELAKSIDATPILYETWARAYNPLMQAPISRAYATLAEANGIQTVPVGTLWEHVRSMRPDLQLFDPDGSHPSTIGTYFISCIFYSFLTGKEASGLPHRITTIDRNGEVLYLHIMDKNDAAFLQEVVDEYLQEKLKNE